MKNQRTILELVQRLKVMTPDSISTQFDFIGKCQLELNQKEALLTKNMSVARRREFIAGRTIVKRMLQDKGINNFPLLMDSYGCPAWPTGTTGSISHKGSICGVLLTDNKCYQSLGFDLEKTESLDQGVWKVFSTSDEINQAISLGLEEGMFANMLFSAKEAIFKCLFPIYTNKTPSILKIEIEVKAHKKNHFTFSFSFSGAIIHGSVATTQDYTISWCSLKYS